MDTDANYIARHRSFNGCWTCRLRRKRCDERHPVCDTCATLLITCHYGQEKPDWMDGSEKQRAMAEQVKIEIKEKAKTYGRRGERERAALVGSAANEPTPPRTPTTDQGSIPGERSGSVQITIEGHESPRGCDRVRTSTGGNIAFSASETVLVSFYLDHVVPFLFPFYRPSPLEGGRSWILDFLLNSPVKRKGTLSQAAYFFSLANGENPPPSCTGGDFPILRRALDVIVGEGVEKHLHGSVRILTGIMQIMHYEISRGGFDNWSAHLNAALALFRQILDTASSEYCSGFITVFGRLGPGPQISGIQVPSAEQAAFKFSTAGLLFADIIASTVQREIPSLYKLYDSLLGGETAPIKLEDVIGVQNWVLLGIAEIVSLNAWKQQRRTSGDLDMMELVRRATSIKEGLSYWLANLTTISVLKDSRATSGLLDTPSHGDNWISVTMIWGRAALLYLSIVVNGWQPASCEVRQNVQEIIKLLSHELSSPSLLRTVVWPFCVAGCLAEPQQEFLFCSMVEKLPAAGVFGPVHKAHDIMAKVWRSRDTIDSVNWDLALSLKTLDESILLI
ncbi:fungal-specific transcription factor domain-containing protein [Lophiotrema nucula]|uniref:Fungal-specific transcription factor domain-containing protein n=1 Tax=Lophiotrema nucula TaxID=690887 RepID=A0A6A5YXA5_9PLEO|nr:fungal-specific transcription factor domain-containing protein [Lophiotrema nucula]